MDQRPSWYLSEKMRMEAASIAAGPGMASSSTDTPAMPSKELKTELAKALNASSDSESSTSSESD